jgi:hypothetical protein
MARLIRGSGSTVGTAAPVYAKAERGLEWVAPTDLGATHAAASDWSRLVRVVLSLSKRARLVHVLLFLPFGEASDPAVLLL